MQRLVVLIPRAVPSGSCRDARAAVVAAVLAVALGSAPAHGQAVVSWTASGLGSAWLTAGNWNSVSGTGVPGVNDVALFWRDFPTVANGAGINMGNPTNNGTRNQAVGAIEVASGRTIALGIGNSNGSTSGTLTLNGATVNGVSNVILRNASQTGLLTISNTNPAQSSTTTRMPVVLNNATNNVILVDGSAGITIASEVRGSSRTLTLAGTGAGILTLSASNSYTGTTMLSAATLQLGNASALGAATNALAVDGGVLNLGGHAVTVGLLTGSSGGQITTTTGAATLTANSAANGTFGGTITGSVALVKQGAGTLTLTGSNSFTGPTTVSAGVLQVGQAGALGGSGNALAVNGGVLDLAGNAVTVGTFTGSSGAQVTTTVGSGTLTVNPAAAGNYAGTLAGALALVKQGAGTLTLSGSSSHSDGTTLSGGGIGIGHAAALGTGTVTFASASFLQATVSATVATPFAVSPGVTGTFDTLGNTVVLSRSGGQIAGGATAHLVKVGSGTLALGGTSGYTGTLTVNDGTLWLQGNSGTASGDIAASAIMVNDGGTFRLGSNGAGNPELPNTTYLTVNAGGRALWQANETFGGVNLLGGTLDLQRGNINGSGSIVQSWTSGTLTNTGVSGTYQFQVNRSIDKTTSGTVAISGLVSMTAFSGTVRILDGTIFHATAANLGTVPILLGSGSTVGTFAYGGGSASRSGAFTLNGLGGTIRVDDAAATLGLDNAVAGAGGLTKTGAGSLLLSAGGAYSGATSVAAGAFVVNGNLASSAVTVSPNASLMGAGTIAGATLIQGLHLPGSSPGIQVFTDGLTYAANGTLVWDLYANTILDRGTNYDGVDVTGGALTIDPAATLQLDFGTTGLGSSVAWNDVFWASNRQWVVIDVSGGGSWNGGLFGTLAVGNDAFGQTLTSIRPDAWFSVKQSGGDLVLVYTVPEPGALALVVGAAATLAVARRCRGRRRDDLE